MNGIDRRLLNTGWANTNTVYLTFNVYKSRGTFNDRDKVKTTWVLFFKKRCAKDYCPPPPSLMQSVHPLNDCSQRLCRTVINTIQCANCRSSGLTTCTVRRQESQECMDEIERLVLQLGALSYFHFQLFAQVLLLVKSVGKICKVW